MVSSMKSVDDVQYGGKHYKTNYQHWNLLPNIGFGLEYYLGCATKYIVRHREKNGAEDVLKAIHFMRKAIELLEANKVPRRFTHESMWQYAIAEVQRFAAENSLSRSSKEYLFVRQALLGDCPADYVMAVEAAEDILARDYASSGASQEDSM